MSGVVCHIIVYSLHLAFVVAIRIRRELKAARMKRPPPPEFVYFAEAFSTLGLAILLSAAQFRRSLILSTRLIRFAVFKRILKKNVKTFCCFMSFWFWFKAVLKRPARWLPFAVCRSPSTARNAGPSFEPLQII